MSLVDRIAAKWDVYCGSDGFYDAQSDEDIRFLLNATADELEGKAGMGPPEYIAAYQAVVERIRSEAKIGGDD